MIRALSIPKDYRQVWRENRRGCGTEGKRLPLILEIILWERHAWKKRRSKSNAGKRLAVPEASSPGPAQKGGAFRALRNRNFRLFWIGQLISLIGTWAQNLAQGWLIVLLVDPVARAMLRHGGAAAGAATQQHGADVEAAANFYSGWVNFAGGLPIFLFTLLAGVVADRVDKRKMLLVTQSALILCAVGLGLLCVLGRVEIWHVMFFAALSGIAAAFDMPTRQSFIAEMVGKEDLPSAIALNSSIFNAARASDLPWPVCCWPPTSASARRFWATPFCRWRSSPGC